VTAALVDARLAARWRHDPQPAARAPALAAGQGDLVATPLQLADAYAAFSNGGTLYQPQLVSRIVDPAHKRVVKTVKVGGKAKVVSVSARLTADTRIGGPNSQVRMSTLWIECSSSAPPPASARRDRHEL